MNIELTKIFQQANNVGATSGGNAQVFINGQGDVSGKSGLGFFKRHFSSAARNEENFASLAAFHEAVAADPRYGAFVRDERIASFFTTKATEGTPLTAQDVREVKARLDEAHLSRIVERRSHSRDNVFSCIPPEPLVEFCMRWGFSLETNEDIRLAVTAFYDEQFTVSARKNLAESRLPEGLRTAAKNGLR